MRHFLAGFADELIKTAADVEKTAVSKAWIAKRISSFAGNKALSQGQKMKRLRGFTDRQAKKTWEQEKRWTGEMAAKSRAGDYSPTPAPESLLKRQKAESSGIMAQMGLGGSSDSIYGEGLGRGFKTAMPKTAGSFPLLRAATKGMEGKNPLGHGLATAASRNLATALLGMIEGGKKPLRALGRKLHRGLREKKAADPMAAPKMPTAAMPTPPKPTTGPKDPSGAPQTPPKATPTPPAAPAPTFGGRARTKMTARK